MSYVKNCQVIGYTRTCELYTKMIGLTDLGAFGLCGVRLNVTELWDQLLIRKMARRDFDLSQTL